MDNSTKVKINLTAGTIELEGSEEFVQKNLDAFKDFILKKKKLPANRDSEKLEAIRSIISELQEECGSASIQDIILRGNEFGIKSEDTEDVERIVWKLKSAGESLKVLVIDSELYNY